MFSKKKCSNCKEKVDRRFHFCPWCGLSLKKPKYEDYGMLGDTDEVQNEQSQTNQIKMPLGLNGIFNTLMKQLEKDLAGMEGGSLMPKGFKIQISSGMPKMQVMNPKVTMGEQPSQQSAGDSISEEERERRAKLKRVDAKSVIRRLPEGLIYEIDTPGVKSKNDIAITKLEKSLEIKAYSDNKCYVKTIPMKVEVLGIVVKADKVFLKLKN